MRLPPLLAATMLAGLFGTCNASDEQLEIEQLRAMTADPQSINDKLFVLTEYHIGIRERALAEVVLARVSDPEVTALAKMVRDGHQLGIDKLRAIAAIVALSLPRDLSPVEHATLDALAALPPNELARYFMIHQRAIHAWDISTFADHAGIVGNARLRQYVSETLDPLRKHADQVVRLTNTKGIPGTLVAIGGEPSAAPCVARKSE